MYRIQLEENFNFGNSNLGAPVNGMEDVSNELHAIHRDNANAELEKDEIVYDPNKLTMHKVIGKWHKDGGVPLNLNEGSFVFSNFKDLSIQKGEKELFEFRLGGTHKAKNNTPAKVLMREIDIPHHNKMVNVLKSNSSDDIAKNSALLMINKNIQKAGQVAYLQEKKKGFEDGVPDFAQNSAPVYDKNTNNQISQNGQYMRTGGLKQYQSGIGNFTSKIGQFNFDNPSYEWDPISKKMVMKQPSNDFNFNLNKTLFGQPKYERYNNTLKSSIDLNPTFSEGFNDGVHAGEAKINNGSNSSSPVPLTGYQMFNALYPLMQRVRTQYPVRANVPQPVVAQPEYINAQSQLNNLDSQLSLSRRMGRIMNPVQGLAAASSIYGQGLDNRSKIIAGVDQQNQQIRNQYNQNLAQMMNQRNATQLQYDQDYITKTQTADYNKYAFRNKLNNQAFSTFNKYIGENQALNNMLNASNAGYRDKNGRDPYRLKPSFFGYTTEFTPGYEGDVFSINTGVNKGTSDLIQKGLEAAVKEGNIDKINAYSKALYSLSGFYKNQRPSKTSASDDETPQGRSGGRFNFRTLNF